MLFQCLSTNAERIQCILKIMFEFMIAYMNHEELDKKVLVINFFCNTNVLVQNVCTKYNVLSVLNLFNMAMFHDYLFAEGTYRAFR